MDNELFGERHEQEENGLFGKQHERGSLEMTPEEFDSTLIHFAELYHKEKQCNIGNVVDRLPEDKVIRDNAREMDEKEFEHWWWETVYKGN